MQERGPDDHRVVVVAHALLDSGGTAEAVEAVRSAPGASLNERVEEIAAIFAVLGEAVEADYDTRRYAASPSGLIRYVDGVAEPLLLDEFSTLDQALGAIARAEDDTRRHFRHDQRWVLEQKQHGPAVKRLAALLDETPRNNGADRQTFPFEPKGRSNRTAWSKFENVDGKWRETDASVVSTGLRPGQMAIASFSAETLRVIAKVVTANKPDVTPTEMLQIMHRSQGLVLQAAKLLSQQLGVLVAALGRPIDSTTCTETRENAPFDPSNYVFENGRVRYRQPLGMYRAYGTFLREPGKFVRGWTQLSDIFRNPRGMVKGVGCPMRFAVSRRRRGSLIRHMWDDAVDRIQPLVERSFSPTPLQKTLRAALDRAKPAELISLEIVDIGNRPVRVIATGYPASVEADFALLEEVDIVVSLDGRALRVRGRDTHGKPWSDEPLVIRVPRSLDVHARGVTRLDVAAARGLVAVVPPAGTLRAHARSARVVAQERSSVELAVLAGSVVEAEGTGRRAARVLVETGTYPSALRIGGAAAAAVHVRHLGQLDRNTPRARRLLHSISAVDPCFSLRPSRRSRSEADEPWDGLAVPLPEGFGWERTSALLDRMGILDESLRSAQLIRWLGDWTGHCNAVRDFPTQRRREPVDEPLAATGTDGPVIASPSTRIRNPQLGL